MFLKIRHLQPLRDPLRNHVKVAKNTSYKGCTLMFSHIYLAVSYFSSHIGVPYEMKKIDVEPFRDPLIRHIRVLKL